MSWEIVLLCNWKKHTISVDHGQGKVPPGYERQSVPITLPDLVTPGTVGFDALHEKLGILATMHTFNLDALLKGIAVTSVIRRVFLTRGCGIPPYVAQHVLDLLRESHACSGYGSLRKTASYADFLLHHTTQQERTVPSINSRKIASKYMLPDDVDDMTVDMLMEELRFAEEKAAKPVQLEKLRGLLRAQQAEEREVARKKATSSGKKLSEIEQILADSHAQERLKAEYDDVPTKKGKKK